MSKRTINLDPSHLMNKALLELREMRAKLKSYEQAKNEPIAIIGMGCRFPGGADNPNAFWQLLRDGVDAITEVPADRWEIDAYYDPDYDAVGKMYTRYGGFVEQLDEFDPQFFGISPREALSLDPQQRLLLEVSWEALENAALVPERLVGSQTGVFMGLCTNDYLYHILKRAQKNIESYLATGNSHSVASGRLSYFLGLQGPNLAVDTACSSSLVAVHLAVMSLRNKECNLALAGGVNRILSPEFSINFCRARMLSPDGRCKTFDLSANGYVRSEGSGVVVLKRLSDALKDGDRIWALIRGSAINQDGRSSGLTVPNGPQQIAVIKGALENAGVTPQEISYVEAHGTGTSLGDPIEVGALGRVFKEREEPLMIGSVKTNIGHLEGGAGIAGLIKVVLALQYEEIPPHLHLEKPNPYINWDELPVRVPTERTCWPRGERKRLAGVSAFGFSGTNAHVVLSEAPAVAHKGAKGRGGNERPYQLLALSAKTEKALTELATRYENHLATQPHLELADVCFTANTGRSHFPHRLSVVAESKSEVTEALRDLSYGQETWGITKGTAQNPPPIAFLFTGQGSQYIGMGQELYETQPTFRRVLQHCDNFLRAGDYLPRPLLEVLYPEAGQSSPIDETAYTQAALFALEYALAKLWQSWGIEPTFVMGHSVGEIVAACVAGVFSLDDGLKLVAERGRLMQSTALGQMVAVMAGEAQVRSATYGTTVAIAAINGPKNVVISGQTQAVQVVVTRLKKQGVNSKTLRVSHAFHSPLMDPILDEFLEVAQQIHYSEPQLGLISNVTGSLMGAEIASASYWVRHIVSPVRFYDGMRSLREKGGSRSIFIEVGPKPILLGMGRQCFEDEDGDADADGDGDADADGDGAFMPSLRPSKEWQELLTTLGELYVRGVEVDWAGFDQDYPRCRVVLPTYPWQRQRYWLSTTESIAATDSPIVYLLNRGDTKQLARQLETTGQFSADERKLMPKLLNLLVRQHQQHLQSKSNIVFDYYNSISQQSSVLQNDGTNDDIFITFGPFPEVVPGFTWLVMAEPQKYPEHVQRSWRAQREMRELLFSQVDFSSVAKVLDFGCGYGSDLIVLAKKYPHLDLCGYTISNVQAQLASQKVATRGLEERVQIFNRDSAKDEFPDHYDLVFGFEVAHHIKEKGQLFYNIERHLNQSGWLVLADFISNAAFPIEHHETSSYFITKDEWVRLLSQNHLKLLKGIDISNEVANYLYDPDFEENLAGLNSSGLDENIRAAFQSYHQLGGLLRKGLASYVLLTAQKQSELRGEELARWNEETLKELTSYSEISPSRWLYGIKWQSCAQKDPSSGRGVGSRPPQAAQKPKSWLIFADSGGVAQALADLLEATGDHCVLVSLGETYGQIGDSGHWRVRPTKKKDFERLLHEIGRPDGVVHLWSLAQSTIDEMGPPSKAHSFLSKAQTLGCGSVLHLIQALAKADWSPRLWLVTQGAVPAGDLHVRQNEQAPLYPQGMIWGLGGVIAWEHPDFHCVRLDLDPSDEARVVLDALSYELSEPDAEEQIAYRQGGRHVARLVRLSPLSIQKQPLIHENATYLITGGLGALGLMVANFLVKQGARHLLLIGRQGACKPYQQQAVKALEQAGAHVRVVKADVVKRDDVARVLSESKSTQPPLRGIVHAAGVLDDGVLTNQSIERFVRVMAPKVQGTWNLHTQTREMPLDFFVCFSGVASLLGSPGQANYAAGNAFMDALAHHRQQLGLPALSINWGPWAEAGMAAELTRRKSRQLSARGIGPIIPEQGLKVFAELLGQSFAQVGVVPINWSKFSQQEAPFFSELRRLQVQPKSKKQLELQAKLENASPYERKPLLITHLQDEVANVLRLQYPALPQQGLFDMGLDSLMAVELRNRLQTNLGISLSSTLFFKYPNIQELAEYLLRRTSSREQSVEESLRATEVELPKAEREEEPVIEVLSQDAIDASIAEELAKLQTLLGN